MLRIFPFPRWSVLAMFADTSTFTLYLLVGLALLILLAVYRGPDLFLRHSLLGKVLELLRDLNAGRTDRRVDPTAPGTVGDVARSANALAGTLEDRFIRAKQDSDNLQALLSHTDEYVLATNPDDKIQFLNPAAERVLERPAASLVGRSLIEILPQRDLIDLYRSAYSANAPVSADMRIATPHRVIQCHVTATSMYSGPQFRGTLLLLRDLTQINQAFQMKTDFVANASHELRTPLSSIRAAVETINETWDGAAQMEDPETVRRCVDIIGGHVLRLQMMVQDLLDLSRTEDPRAVVRMERVDLQQLAEMIVGMYAPLASEKKLRLLVDIAPDARAVRGDERLLVLTIKNLVDNAVKFTPANGQITIRSYQNGPVPATTASAPAPAAAASPDAAAAAPATPSASPKRSAEALLASSTVIEVVDTGCGIPPEDQQRVFERFYTVNRSRGGADRGTGLGLAIVKHALTAMGAIVQLSSVPQQGTTIRCLFPNNAGPQPLPTAASASAPALPPK